MSPMSRSACSLTLILAAACSSDVAGRASGDESEATQESPATPGSPELLPKDEVLISVDDMGVVPSEPKSSPELTEGSACEGIASEPQEKNRPIDVILLVDNSDSMSEEIAAIERNININFAAILDESGIDYRVILLSKYRVGPAVNQELPVCIGAPLGPSACEGRSVDDSPHGERFFHFDQFIASQDPNCRLLDTLRAPPTRSSIRETDELSSQGWLSQLRKDSFKAFVPFSDATNYCGTEDGLTVKDASVFDERLRTDAPEWFGGLDEPRKYGWYSVVGIAEKDDPAAVYEPDEEINYRRCDSAGTPAIFHQELSVLTGALRYSVCNTASYDAVFQRVASEVVAKAGLPCSWQIPEAPEGKTFNRDLVNINYAPGGGGAPPEIGRVENLAACGVSSSWYYDNLAQPTSIHACPAACELLSNDEAGSIELLFGCATRLSQPK